MVAVIMLAPPINGFTSVFGDFGIKNESSPLGLNSLRYQEWIHAHDFSSTEKETILGYFSPTS